MILSSNLRVTLWIGTGIGLLAVGELAMAQQRELSCTTQMVLAVLTRSTVTLRLLKKYWTTEHLLKRVITVYLHRMTTNITHGRFQIILRQLSCMSISK